MFEDRKIVFITGVLILFAILFGKLFLMQIYDRKKYEHVSDINRIRRVRVVPNRGQIFDRNGKVLVENEPAFSVFAVPYETKSPLVTGLLSQILNDSTEKIPAKIQNTGNPFTPVKLMGNIAFEQLIQIEERKLELPGVFIKVDPKRKYPAGASSAHIVGYLAEISKKELEDYDRADVLQGDNIGKKGLEKQYDYLLRGTSGYNFIEVNALGQEMEDKDFSGETPPTPGSNISLTLDLEMQTLAEELFAGKQGGAVFLDAHNGGVLTLCSKPDYDPVIFAGNLSSKDWQGLLNDPRKPLYDRMLQGEFPPGSTFKLVALSAALENNLIDVNTRFTCTGAFRFGARNFNCWNHNGHGNIDLLDAIRMSCNVYLYNTSLKVGIDLWGEYTKKFGFGQITGIDIPGERPGTAPDRVYLDRVYDKKWTNGLLLNLGIGQGDLLVTPLQMAQFAMILANKGTFYKPHIVQKYMNSYSSEYFEPPVTMKRTSGISDNTYNVMREGMRQVINEPGGTGHAAALKNIDVAGKTGTAQNPHGDDHAWFIGFAPFNNPCVAFCVLVENGGHGGTEAAPIAGKLLELYFQKYSLLAQN